MKSNAFIEEESGKALVSKLCARGNLKEDIAHAIDAIGGLGKVVEPGDTILLKPNFNTADPPPASSDPAFVRAVIELLYEQGAAKVILGESSTFTASTRQVLARTGMLQAAQEAGAAVVIFDKGEWVEVEAPGRYLKRVSLAKPARDVKKLVYVTCLKTHRNAGFTMSLKLAVAFVRRRHRLWLHLRRLQEKIAELNTLVHPNLIITDGRMCFVRGGPDKGELRHPGVILASGDRIAIDVEGLKILESYPAEGSLKGDPWQFPQIRRAVELGLGVSSQDNYVLHEITRATPG